MVDPLTHLKAAGLSSEQSLIFKVLLEAAPLSVSEIARRTGIKRTSVYEHIAPLLKTGLLRKEIAGRRARYASEPRGFIRLAKEREDQARASVKRAESLVRELEAQVPLLSRAPQVSIYEGKRGIAHAYHAVLDTWDDVYSIFTPRAFFAVFTPADNRELLSIVRERGFRLNNLMESSPEAHERLRVRTFERCVRSKLLPPDIAFSCDIIASKQRLALIAFGALTATVIDDAALAETQRTFMRALWDRL